MKERGMPLLPPLFGVRQMPAPPSSPTIKICHYQKIHFIFLFFISILLPNNAMAFGSSSDYDIFRYKCPDGCMCVPDVIDGNQLVINCELDHLESLQTFVDFPRNATKTLTLRCLSHKHDSIFGDDMFEGFKTLRDLKISNCHGTELPANTFRGLPKLEFLYLSELSSTSKVLTFSPQLFHPIKALQKLTLTSSAIRDFPDGLFCPLSDLKILNLTTNNLSSTKLEQQSAQKCELNQLIILDLSGNVIESIEADDLAAYPSLRQFFIAGNGITDIHESAFKSLSSLQHLDFEDNELKEMIALPESILHLSLARNKLANIPASVANLKKLVHANFSHNSIDSNTPFSLQSDSLEAMDLSFNNFDSVPLKLFHPSFSSIQTLYLSNNQIAVLQPSQFQNLTKLSKLDLSNNRIKTLTEGCFDGLTELQDLNLRNNSIYHIDVGVFGDISHRLHKLDMSKNLLVELPMAITRLAKIKTMDFSENQINKLYKFVLNKMVHLSKLDLSSNRIPSIESYIFSSCPHLAELNLANNRIDGIASDAFDQCPKFRNLDLSENRISIFGGSLALMRSLKFLNISANNLQTFEWTEFPEGLQKIDASNNKITILAPATPSSKLRNLKLNNNRLTKLGKSQLSDQIDDIDLSGNRIDAIEDDVFAVMKNLNQINLRNNKLRFISSKTFRDSESSMLSGLLATRIFLQGNPLECHCEMAWITQLSAKTTLQIVDSPLTTCKHMVDKTANKLLSEAAESDFLCPYDQTCEPNCICCQYGNCDCKSKCPEGCSCFHDQDFKTNVVECKALNETASRSFSPKILPMHATHILLEKLHLPTLKTHDFMSRTRLVELRINASGVRIIQPLTFNTLQSLTKLDLSGNELTELRGDEMFKTQRIEELNLQKNHLYELDNRLLEQLPNLQALNLAGNDFDELPEMIILSQNLKETTLSRNPFRCDCNWRRFRVQAWLIDNIAKVKDANLMECAENVTKSFLSNDTTVLTSLVPNRGDHIFVLPMLDFINQANQTFCVIEVSGFFGGGPGWNIFLGIFFVFVVILALIGFVYVILSLLRRTSGNSKNRYKKAPPSLNCSTATPGCSPLPLIQYDAFISYSKHDENTILNNLCRPLENEDFTLCLLHQDGAKHTYTGARHAISDDLIHQLDACQCLIMFVTKNFLENEWSTLQIKTSHQLFAKNNKRIIGILDENVQANELDHELGQILRKNLLLKSNDAIFWKLLFASMPQRLHLQNSSGSTMLGGDGSDIYSEAYGSIVPSEVV